MRLAIVRQLVKLFALVPLLVLVVNVARQSLGPRDTSPHRRVLAFRHAAARAQPTMFEGLSSELPESPQPVCPDGKASDGGRPLAVIHRFCRRATQRCASTRLALQWHLANVQPPSQHHLNDTRSGLGHASLSQPQTSTAAAPRYYILHRERAVVGAGYAHVLQVRPQTLPQPVQN